MPKPSIAVYNLRNRRSQRKKQMRPRKTATARLMPSRRELKTLLRLSKRFRIIFRPSNLRSKEPRSKSKRRRSARSSDSRKRRQPSKGRRNWLSRKKKKERKRRNRNARQSSNAGRKRRPNASRGWSKK